MNRSNLNFHKLESNSIFLTTFKNLILHILKYVYNSKINLNLSYRV